MYTPIVFFELLTEHCPSMSLICVDRPYGININGECTTFDIVTEADSLEDLSQYVQL